MKKLISLLAIVAVLIPSGVFAAYTHGYYRSNGTYVSGYHRTSPNAYKWDNYSSWGNINPYTGKKGHAKWW